MFLRKIRQKVYTLRLDCIVKLDSSLSPAVVSERSDELDCIVKLDSSLSNGQSKALSTCLIVL